MRHQLFCLLALLCACQQQDKSETTVSNAPNISEAHGVVVPAANLKPPKTVSLADMPKPITTEVPLEAGKFTTLKENGKETKIALLPPEVKPAVLYYIMRNYTAEDGLALDYVTASAMDRAGNLWFGTRGGGVSRFDGYAFTNYPFMGTIVWSILQDSQGNLWFGAEEGASKYDGKDCTVFTTKDGLPNPFIRCMYEDKKGNVWFGTEGGGVSQYDGKSFKNYAVAQGLVHNSVWSITEDREGNIWFATQDGVSKYDGTAFTNYTKAQGLADNFVHSVVQDKAGNLWFATENGVSKYDGKTFVNFTQAEGLAKNKVWVAFEDTKGNLWFGTDKGGASRYDGKTFTNISKSNGLSGSTVLTIVEDKIGNLWFGIEEGGVCRYEGEAFQNYTSVQGIGNSGVMSILNDTSGNMWFGTLGGLTKYDRKEFTNYTTAQGLPYNEVRGVLEDQEGYLWFGTHGGGVAKFDGKSFTTYTTAQGLGNDDVRCIYQDQAGDIWFATFGGGLSRFDGTSFTNYTTEQGLVGNYLKSILKDSHGNLWLSANEGISKFDGHTFTNYTKEQGLGNNFAISIFEDTMGNLWINTDSCLLRYDGKSFLTYTTLQGLPDNLAYRTIATPQQDLLIGTNKGIAILKEYIRKPSGNQATAKLPAQNNVSNAELKDYTPVFEIFNEKTGYPIPDLNSGQNSIFLDKEGIIWFGTGSDKTGLVRFDYAALHTTKAPPHVVIQNMKVNDEKVSWYDLKENELPIDKGTVAPNVAEEEITFGRTLTKEEIEVMRRKFGALTFTGITKFYYLPEDLKLPYEYNHLTFDFMAIEPDRAQNVLYQYKLEGYNKDWSPPSKGTSADFGNIFEGAYQLKIKARSPFGVWSEPITYTFRVLPPWYRTWWAYGIYLSCVFTVIYIIHMWRTAVLRRRYERLQILYRATERFVPKNYFDILHKEHIQDVKLGEAIDVMVTTMFSDIRGYTSIMEKQTPEEAFVFINAYLEAVAPIIRAHNGFINSFMGDGIMALFPRSADDGIRAIQAMKEAQEAFNQSQAGHLAAVKVGYALNTGMAMIGILGEKERLSANVIGDTINLTSRIESLNKFYGTEFLASESTIHALQDEKQYIMRLLDKVVVKGKKKAIYLYEVSFTNSVDANKLAFNKLYEAAFRAYEKGNFAEALNQFKEALQLSPGNPSTLLFIERCEGFLQGPIPEGWDGVYVMKQK